MSDCPWCTDFGICLSCAQQVGLLTSQARRTNPMTCEFCGCGLTPELREQANEIAEARLADGKDCPYVCCPGCAESLEPTPPVEWEP